MRSVCLVLCRFCTCAWVGAAVLFVWIALREVLNPAFDSTMKDELALLRFPAYYAFGFVAVPLALASGWIARRHESVSARRITVATAILAIALVLLTVDYLSIYGPMALMISPPGRARPPEFTGYHAASEWVNVAHVGLSFAAAILYCWPNRAKAADRSRGPTTSHRVAS